LYGLETEEQANQKLLEIYETITDAGLKKTKKYSNKSEKKKTYL